VGEKAAKSHFTPLSFLPLTVIMPKHASFAGSKAIEKDILFIRVKYILLCFGRAEKRCEEGATLKVMKKEKERSKEEEK